MFGTGTPSHWQAGRNGSVTRRGSAKNVIERRQLSTKGRGTTGGGTIDVCPSTNEPDTKTIRTNRKKTTTVLCQFVGHTGGSLSPSPPFRILWTPFRLCRHTPSFWALRLFTAVFRPATGQERSGGELLVGCVGGGRGGLGGGGVSMFGPVFGGVAWWRVVRVYMTLGTIGTN